MLFISLLSNSLAKLGEIQLSLLNCSLVKIFSLSLSKSCGALQCGGYLRNIALLKLVLWNFRPNIYIEWKFCPQHLHIMVITSPTFTQNGSFISQWFGYLVPCLNFYHLHFYGCFDVFYGQKSFLDYLEVKTEKLKKLIIHHYHLSI